jgi:hypothetical protein
MGVASGVTRDACARRVEITTPPTSDIFSHAISPDGRRVVFVAFSPITLILNWNPER